MNPQESHPVVAVCGNEARIYGPATAKGKRLFIGKKTFAHHGAAVLFAQDYEEKAKKK